jgi:hypothetical protein
MRTLIMPLNVAWEDALNRTGEEWTTTSPKEGEDDRGKSLKGMIKSEHGGGRQVEEPERADNEIESRTVSSFSQLVSFEHEIEKCLVVCRH